MTSSITRTEVENAVTALDHSARWTATRWYVPAQKATIAGHKVTIGYRNVKSRLHNNRPIMPTMYCRLDGRRIAYANLVDALCAEQPEAIK